MSFLHMDIGDTLEIATVHNEIQVTIRVEVDRFEESTWSEILHDFQFNRKAVESVITHKQDCTWWTSYQVKKAILVPICRIEAVQGTLSAPV